MEKINEELLGLIHVFIPPSIRVPLYSKYNLEMKILKAPAIIL